MNRTRTKKLRLLSKHKYGELTLEEQRQLPFNSFFRRVKKNWVIARRLGLVK